MLSPLAFTNPQPIFFDHAMLASLGLTIDFDPTHSLTGPLLAFAGDDTDDDADDETDEDDDKDEDDLDEDEEDEDDEEDDTEEDDADGKEAEDAPELV